MPKMKIKPGSNYDGQPGRVAARRRYNRNYYAQTAFARGFKKDAWGSEEDIAILERKVPDAVLSVRLQRSVGAIQTRRVRLIRDTDY